MTPDLESIPAARAGDRLQHYVRWYDNALPAELCAGLIAGFEQMQTLQEANGRGLRAGLDQSAWTELNLTRLADPAMQGFFFAQVDKHLARYNAEVSLTLPIPPSHRTADLVIKRYRKGTEERFQPHFDSINEAANRYLVFLWYLNDVAEGGETEFCDLHVRVQARAGRLLMFPPYWMYQHAGLPPLSGDKYILSTYLLFQPSAVPSVR
ncbi:MAG: 2OG-Fe(II) oxygenase [Xanthomonadaceae bacterium]|nr:2OG-Fe(II) oxygenase [Xanthomonadaceae bacterium]MDE1959628.1 2OG-Fe(II) oxygenase [Xanthomonadaceae bacterium]MDE2176842.1 2OG-Fe(II) oxygenase [Xanthomonadaceae bacterium]MDE2246274.1 2OG-Fe(II) oxygenase [Xanthomonadaceae bacterium]